MLFGKDYLQTKKSAVYLKQQPRKSHFLHSVTEGRTDKVNNRVASQIKISKREKKESCYLCERGKHDEG